MNRLLPASDEFSAVTGVDAFERFREAETILDQVTSGLRTSRAEMPAQVEKLQDELQESAARSRRPADENRQRRYRCSAVKWRRVA